MKITSWSQQLKNKNKHLAFHSIFLFFHPNHNQSYFSKTKEDISFNLIVNRQVRAK